MILLMLLAGGVPSDGPQSDEWRNPTVQVYEEMLRDDHKLGRDTTLSNADRVPKAQLAQERRFRRIAADALKDRLRDPASAEFQWPYGFAYQEWNSRVGYLTCGKVNARNGFGGYNGFRPFIVMLAADGRVQGLEFGSRSDSFWTQLECKALARRLPPADPGVDAASE